MLMPYNVNHLSESVSTFSRGNALHLKVLWDCVVVGQDVLLFSTELGNVVLDKAINSVSRLCILCELPRRVGIRTVTSRENTVKGLGLNAGSSGSFL